jgi:DNA-directed RNA polymerase sigma subunit (sigma70/sigma32)
MPNISDNTLHQLDALNNWLAAVYGEGTAFGTLLLDAGFSEAEIEHIKREHLSEFLQAVIDLLASYNDFSNDARYKVMLQHYGLIDGKPLDFWVIGHSYGVAGERIRQLVNRRLDLYRDPKRQAKFQYDFAAIGRRLLDNESSSQG